MLVVILIVGELTILNSIFNHALKVVQSVKDMMKDNAQNVQIPTMI